MIIGQGISQISVIDFLNKNSIHGNAYFVKGYADMTSPGNPKYFMFKTPTTKSIHFAFDIKGNEEYIFDVFYSPSIIADGTLITPINMNHQYPNNNLMQPYADPTVNLPGTPYIGARFGSSRAFGSINQGYLLTAKKNTTYLTRTTKVNAGTTYIDFTFYWIEDWE